MVSSAETSSRHDLTFIRAYYFVLIGGWGFLYPFLSVFYRRQGLSGTEIGIIGTTQAVAALVAAPLWGRWSDASGRVRRLLQISFLLTAILTLILGRQNLFWPIVTTALLITPWQVPARYRCQTRWRWTLPIAYPTWAMAAFGYTVRWAGHW